MVRFAAIASELIVVNDLLQNFAKPNPLAMNMGLVHRRWGVPPPEERAPKSTFYFACVSPATTAASLSSISFQPSS